ncbi:SulP family inorganic anion transporter [Blastopirellula retiformator]|nr:permease [Blastopirellula retiformator]
MTKKTPTWAAAGDVNAFFGLMLDNIADLLLTIGLLATVFDFPTNFAISHMAPGTAIGVLVGDLAFFVMALALARRTGRNDVTAMPLGLDTPSTFGMVFFVLGPAFIHAQHILQLGDTEAAVYTWHIGICSIVLSGIFKVLCAFGSGWIRKFLPRAGLLGSLAAVALVLISFLPFVESLHYPVVGMTALAIILTTLVARIGLPKQIPGALAALLIAGTIYYIMNGLGILGAAKEEMPFNPHEGLLPTDWLAVFRFGWLAQMGDALNYLPVVIPFALGTVIGGIDCVESAAAVGDEYDTDRIILVEAIATLIAGLCGGVIQTTPYIGHPAYKAMGGRSAYVLATALFVGGAGVIGYFGYLYWLVPKSTVFPILVFIGLEITAQSFLATTKKHYAAVSLACVPALAALVLVFVDDAQGQYMGQAAQLTAAVEALPPDTEGLDKLKASAETIQSISQGNFFGPLGVKLQTLRMLSGGFILTSLMWASALAMIIDRRLLTAAGFFVVCGVFSLFGVIHSPLPGSPVFLPFWYDGSLGQWVWHPMPDMAAGQTPIYMLAAYLSAAAVLVAFHYCRAEDGPSTESSDDWEETT